MFIHVVTWSVQNIFLWLFARLLPRMIAYLWGPELVISESLICFLAFCEGVFSVFIHVGILAGLVVTTWPEIWIFCQPHGSDKLIYRVKNDFGRKQPPPPEFAAACASAKRATSSLSTNTTPTRASSRESTADSEPEFARSVSEYSFGSDGTNPIFDYTNSELREYLVHQFGYTVSQTELDNRHLLQERFGSGFTEEDSSDDEVAAFRVPNFANQDNREFASLQLEIM